MNITVIGAGNMGSALTQLLSRAGHDIRITARNISRAAAVAAANPRTVAVPAKDAARDASAVIIATAYADATPARGLEHLLRVRRSSWYQDCADVDSQGCLKWR